MTFEDLVSVSYHGIHGVVVIAKSAYCFRNIVQKLSFRGCCIAVGMNTYDP